MTDPDRGGRWFENVPWWMVSMGLHAVVLLGAALVYFDQLFAEVTIIDTRISQEAPRKFVEPPARRDDFDRRRVASDGEPVSALDNVVVFDGLSEPGDGRIPCDLGFPLRSIAGVGGGRPVRAPAGTFRGNSNYESRTVGCPGTPHPKAPKATEDAVQAALQWLVRHQSANGGWSAGSAAACCGGTGEAEFDTGASALALLAFLGAGYSHVTRDERGTTVKRALQALLERQDPEGCVGPRGPKYLYNHAIAALALAEAYGMTGSAVLREPAQNAIDFLVAAQNPGRGWRYDVRPGENDTSVTGWAVLALKSAELSELRFPRHVYDGALAWLDEATESAGGRAGYRRAGTGKVVEVGVNERFADHPTMTAVSVVSRLFMTKKPGDAVQQGARLIASDLPAWEADRIDFYYWYYGSMAIFQKDGPDGPLWRAWGPAMKAALVPHQAKDGCRRGSWDPSVDRWGHAGGRVAATALNCLTLEVYYRVKK